MAYQLLATTRKCTLPPPCPKRESFSTMLLHPSTCYQWMPERGAPGADRLHCPSMQHPQGWGAAHPASASLRMTPPTAYSQMSQCQPAGQLLGFGLVDPGNPVLAPPVCPPPAGVRPGCRGNCAPDSSEVAAGLATALKLWLRGALCLPHPTHTSSVDRSQRAW